jgi:diguanylate cyclase (GGDEF)-like protein/PAS domain S-box-containing protein
MPTSMFASKSFNLMEFWAPEGGWLAMLGLTSSDNPFQADSLDRRLSGLAISWLSILIALIPGTIPVGIGLAPDATPLALIVGLWVTVGSGFVLSYRHGKQVLSLQTRVRLHSGLAALSGILLTSLVISATAGADVLIAMIALGSTTFVFISAMARLPVALVAFALGVAARGLPLAQDWVIPTLCLTLLCCFIFVAVHVGRAAEASARQRWVTDQEATRSNRLLDEVEQNSPSWFWETDRQGLITYISPKLSAWVGLPPGGLQNQFFTTIAAEPNATEAGTPVGERTLAFYLSTRTAFSELAVPAAVEGHERWWSISGRPVLDKFGHFRGFIGTGSDLTEQRRSEAEVSKLARFDPLTGLANRSETAKVLRRALTGQPGTMRPTGLILIDLDRFKAVNDTMGHPAGDDLLKEVAARLSRVIGPLGQVGRLGGDEFKIVLPGVDDVKRLANLADSIISSISEPYEIQGSRISVGASLGIAIAPHDGASADDLIRNADLALYAAKAAGRGVHRFYETTMHSAAEERRLLERDLREALGRGEFRLVYQPIVALDTEQIIGFESLIRWSHPTRGAISPADFIPIAEESGLIEGIGEWTLRQACAEAASWAVDARVAVNVSAIQFANPNFPTLVAQVLAQSGLQRDRLELELTESVFIADNDETDAQFARLKKIGVRLALDDFGTGYSSLGYLKRAPFDKIKIDQSFVRGASLGHDRNAAIIKAIVTLAQTMELETTAEGVETQDEVDFIRDLGCSHIQGFVFGRPLEAEALRARLGERGNETERLGPKATRENRLRVLRNARMTVNGSVHIVRIRNLSNGGAMIEGPNWMTAGTLVSLEILDGMSVPAVVKWIDDGRIGIGFDYPIDMSRINEGAVRAA